MPEPAPRDPARDAAIDALFAAVSLDDVASYRRATDALRPELLADAAELARDLAADAPKIVEHVLASIWRERWYHRMTRRHHLVTLWDAAKDYFHTGELRPIHGHSTLGPKEHRCLTPEEYEAVHVRPSLRSRIGRNLVNPDYYNDY